MINRRSFLFGFGATAALVTLPTQIVTPLAEQSYTPFASSAWRTRSIYDVMFGLDHYIPGADHALEWTLGRSGSDLPILRTCVHVNATYRWVAVPDAAIVVLPGNILRVDVSPTVDTARVVMIGTDILLDGGEEQFCETYRWPGPQIERVLMRDLPIDDDDNEKLWEA